ncbi:hypothetical protein DUI87_18657 [Hirundo rustica rustica]|uniref:Reverse transcriptase domain-containing protein n=1 Tax=Hirundo rustica rustica TaxID=333673 RepID=A0A3M0K2L8_HIRRU|nr:hypothetical protein DUI87_18657 [Hirundo rustica rustica]
MGCHLIQEYAVGDTVKGLAEIQIDNIYSPSCIHQAGHLVIKGDQWDSILGPVLFNIFIYDLDTGLERILSKLANDIKLGEAVVSLKGREARQRDLGELEDWESSN